MPEGRQHHTLDMELFGPSSWLEGFYLAALKAGSEMANYLGHNAETKEIKYQIADGCEIDQMCAEWHANISGLGSGWGVFECDKEKSAVMINDGTLLINKLKLGKIKSANEVIIDGKKIAFNFKYGIISFDDTLIKNKIEIFY